MTLDTLTLVVIFIIGASVGSFLNVIAYRSIKGGTILFDRSKCPRCNHKLVFFDLIPILSFVLLKGKCRYCDKKISWQYPIVELVTALLFTLIFYVNFSADGVSLSDLSLILTTVFSLFVVAVLIVVFTTDIKSGLIPDNVLLPSIIIAFLFKVVLLFTSQLSLPEIAVQLVSDALSGLLAGFLFYLIILFSKGRAMGGGDVKFVVFIGFVLGLSKLSVALFLAFLTGAAVALILILIGKKRFGQTVPFGPFLSIGAVIALIWGQQILDWYLRLNT